MGARAALRTIGRKLGRAWGRCKEFLCAAELFEMPVELIRHVRIQARLRIVSHMCAGPWHLHARVRLGPDALLMNMRPLIPATYVRLHTNAYIHTYMYINVCRSCKYT